MRLTTLSGRHMVRQRRFGWVVRRWHSAGASLGGFRPVLGSDAPDGQHRDESAGDKEPCTDDHGDLKTVLERVGVLVVVTGDARDDRQGGNRKQPGRPSAASFTPEATPAYLVSAEASTVVVNGATSRDSPNPKTTTAGNTSRA